MAGLRFSECRDHWKVVVPIASLPAWMEEQSGSGAVWYVKRLSANDTQATGGHQAGPYIPKDFLFSVFPSMNRPDARNPDKSFDLFIDSHAHARKARAIWYNQGTRNESRITRLGGIESALLDPDSTGALVVFAFPSGQGSENHECHVWVCDDETEADLVEDLVGPVEPGTQGRVWNSRDSLLGFFQIQQNTASCWLSEEDIPREWLINFPTGADIIKKTVELRPLAGLSVDSRLMQRRACEYEVFLSVEAATILPLITGGFTSMEEFVTLAQSVLQRRKSRAGRSLELHIRQLLLEENLVEGLHFAYQPVTERNKQPDFLFPNQQTYVDRSFPAKRLMMLAAKTTVRERWRQIISEADRIPTKHLLTVQRGVSENQFRQMQDAGVQLVVPEPLKEAYPKSVRPHLMSLESFLADVRLLNMAA